MALSELPGRRLREAREARGLSLADAANALKFSPRQIEALEADDYQGLQGATFVRGFIRSYARFLKLAPEPLLAMLDAGTPLQMSEVRPPDDTGAAMPQPGERRLSAWVAGAIVLVVIAASLIAWHLVSPESAPSMPRELAAMKSETPSVQPAVQPPVARIEPAAAPDAGGTSPVAPPVATVLPPDGRQLVLTFSDKSWVEIKDANQRVILSGEFPGGDRQVANGKPPFQLWVGRASAVRILDGDREIDLKPHARDEVARLIVD
jgi:cytoskeleton protein RodZ